jgi:hypothetical protein
VPVSVIVAPAAGFLLVAVNVAVSPAVVVGAYWTMTVQCFFGPRLIAVQASEVIVNADDPDREIVRALDAVPPEFVSENVCDGEGLWPIVTVPKSYVPTLVVGDQANDGGDDFAPTDAGESSTTAAATSTATGHRYR